MKLKMIVLFERVGDVKRSGFCGASRLTVENQYTRACLCLFDFNEKGKRVD